jgi:hypothetical protein
LWLLCENQGVPQLRQSTGDLGVGQVIAPSLRRQKDRLKLFVPE